MNGKPSVLSLPTIGNPNYFTTYKLTDGSLVNVHTLDTAGQETFKSLTENYYKKADCCLLVYDISNYKSFEECKTYYNKCIKEKCKNNIKVILLGNKTDLENKRKVESKEASDFALENEYMFMETSCLKNTNVANAFETLIEITNIEAKKNGDTNTNKGLKLKNEKTNFLQKICPCLFK